ncbi:hypothetical protein ETD83_16800 [Actinomadura soli]|uniref:Gram-positive cocci surface proteins LPxTG domain-containing protein n=1 Tax=Actinomadura soli TaxID=2508997 RepID=A0A5C4JD32_9ACTN|nr:hypothetical protein [Actinomadura soli]TMR00415.1 hypothetical protein ETD83_16800 [Actinomadura soli]
MTLTRLAAAGAAAACLVLGTAGAAHAQEQPQINVSPRVFTPGQAITITITECTQKPTINAAEATRVFTAVPAFTGTPGEKWTARQATRSNLIPGKTYTVNLTCTVGEQTVKGSITVNPGKKPSPKPTPTKPGSPAPQPSSPVPVPSGPINTGDGSTQDGGSGTTLLAGGAAVALAGAGMGAFALRRRAGRERS